MINVRLAGGLGNQIFQLACALRYAKYDIEKIRLRVDDLSKYKTPRKFELPKLFDLTLNFCKPSSSLLLKTRLARFLKFTPCFVNDKNYLMKREYPHLYLDGYFQFEQDWELLAPAAIYLQQVLNEKYSLQKTNNLVIHARGGDFLNNENSRSHQYEFYEKVLNRHELAPFSTGELYCSDQVYAQDIVKYFAGNGIDLHYRASGDDDWEADFKRLMSAKLLIGSRSTFAWWASLLGEVNCFFPEDFTINKPRNLYHPWEINASV